MGINIRHLDIPNYYWKSYMEIFTNPFGKKMKRFPRFGTGFEFLPDSYKNDGSILLFINDFDESVYISHGIEFQEVKKGMIYEGKTKYMFEDILFNIKFLYLSRKKLIFQIKTKNCSAKIIAIPCKK